MDGSAFTLFDTAIGPCGLAWGERGVVALGLPEADADQTRARLRSGRPGAREIAPPAAVAAIVARVAGLLAGARDDLADIPLDLEGLPAFHRRVWQAARAVGPGRTTTYGGLAASLGEPGAARAVGHALGRNPVPIIVPCHRVLAAGRRPGGFSAHGGVATKLRLLAIEGALPPPEPDLFAPPPGR